MRHRLPAFVLAGALLMGGAGALAQAEADRRLDAAIERLRQALGPDIRIEIGRRQVDPVSGSAVLTDVVLTDGQVRLAIPEFRVSGVSETRLGRAEALGATIRLPEGGTGEIARMLVAGLPIPVPGKSLDLGNLSFDALEFEGARIADPARGSLRLDRLTARDWRPEGVAAAAVEGFAFEGLPRDNQTAELRRLSLEAVALPLRHGEFDPLPFRAGRIALEGAAIRDGASEVTIIVGRLDLRDWVPDRLTSLAIEGVQVAVQSTPQGAVEFTLARLDSSGVDAARTLEAVISGVQVPDPTPGTPQRLLLQGLDAAWQGQPLLSLARMGTEAALENGTATGSFVTEGLRVQLPRGQVDWLEGLGYREVLGGLELRGAAARAGGPLEIAPLRLAWEQAATLNLAARLDGMPPAPAPGSVVDQDATLVQLMAARVETVTLSLRDHGLLGRIIARQAREQRMPDARLREQWAQMALAMPLPGTPPPAPPARRGAPPPKAAEAADPLAPMRQAVAAFIRQPGTLEITLRPPKPVAFNELAGLGGGNPAETVQRLGLSVVAR